VILFPVFNSQSTDCIGPAGTMKVGESFRQNSTSFCEVCTCVLGVDGLSPHLQCLQPACPNIDDCPEDMVYHSPTSCCPLCKDHIDVACTGGADTCNYLSNLKQNLKWFYNCSNTELYKFSLKR